MTAYVLYHLTIAVVSLLPLPVLLGGYDPYPDGLGTAMVVVAMAGGVLASVFALYAQQPIDTRLLRPVSLLTVGLVSVVIRYTVPGADGYWPIIWMVGLLAWQLYSLLADLIQVWWDL